MPQQYLALPTGRTILVTVWLDPSSRSPALQAAGLQEGPKWLPEPEGWEGDQGGSYGKRESKAFCRGVTGRGPGF